MYWAQLFITFLSYARDANWVDTYFVFLGVPALRNVVRHEAEMQDGGRGVLKPYVMLQSREARAKRKAV